MFTLKIKDKKTDSVLELYNKRISNVGKDQ